MDYSLRNLGDIPDQAPRFGFSDVQESRFPREDLESKTIGLAFHRLKAGQRQAFAHRHEQAEEIYVVLSGTGQIKLDDERKEIGPLDAIRVAPHVTRAFEAGPDQDLELLAFGPRHAGDGELVHEGFWEE
jgi:mannose-6-phosphate isomerase-like protein (cupin superfamily)